MGRNVTWILVIVVAAVMLWQFGQSEDERDTPSALPEHAANPPPVRPDSPAAPGPEPAATSPPEGADTGPAPAAAPVPPRVPKHATLLPLADVVMPEAEWQDARGPDVLRELAAFADRPLRITAGARRLVEGIRFTHSSKNQTVAKLLDLVLLDEIDVKWTIRDGAIEVYFDDD